MPVPTDDVAFVRPELVKVSQRYRVVRDCVEQTVKDRGAVYLPRPNGADTSLENSVRYDAYLGRAVFYGVTGRTLGGMVGQVYANEPVIKVPAQLEAVKKDATGSGLSLVQLSKDAMRFTMAYGRAGVYVDFPTMDRTVSRAEIISGTVRPVMSVYDPEDIINWRTQVRNGVTRLVLVVLREMIDEPGEFSITQSYQYRVLRLTPFGEYTVEVWRENGEPGKNVGISSTFGATPPKGYDRVQGPTIVTGADGKPFPTIPFSFIGASNNDSWIDEVPLYDLANLNIGHYRNSADFEESSFFVGQPTLWISGLDVEWVEDVMKGQVYMGSRAAIPLPVGANAGLIQAQPNTLPREAMTHKEAQMVALGARLVENRSVRRTAFEVGTSNAAETSILADCANNVSSAMTYALRWCAMFIGASEDVSFALNTEFAITRLSPEEQRQLIESWQSGAITFEEMRSTLRRSAIATEPDEQARTAIAKEQEAAAKRNADAAAAANAGDNTPADKTPSAE